VGIYSEGAGKFRIRLIVIFTPAKFEGRCRWPVQGPGMPEGGRVDRQPDTKMSLPEGDTGRNPRPCTGISILQKTHDYINQPSAGLRLAFGLPSASFGYPSAKMTCVSVKSSACDVMCFLTFVIPRFAPKLGSFAFTHPTNRSTLFPNMSGKSRLR